MKRILGKGSMPSKTTWLDYITKIGKRHLTTLRENWGASDREKSGSITTPHTLNKTK